MISRSKQVLSATLAASLLTLACGTGRADTVSDSVDTSNWNCTRCPYDYGWSGEWGLGSIFVSDPSLRFGDYRGLEDEGSYLAIDGETRYRNEKGHYLDLFGSDLGLDSRRLDLRGGKQGSYEFRVDYQEIPRFLGHGTQTPFTGVGTGQLELPRAWISAPLTSRMKALDSTLSPTDLASERKQAGAGLTLRIGSAWKYEMNFQRQTREGTRPIASGIYTASATVLPAPVDFTTDQFDAGLFYGGKRSHWRVAFSGSRFDNGSTSVTWENPFSIHLGDDYLRGALAPGNEHQRLSLSGSVVFSPRVRFSVRAAMGESEQDEAFLPYTINPRYQDMSLPRGSLDGKVDAALFNLSARFQVRLASRLDMTAQFKTDERDNRTPVDFYTPVVDDVARYGPLANVPYGYEREQGKLEFRYRTRGRARFNAGVKTDTLQRTYQEVTETDESSVWGDMRFNPGDSIAVHLKFENMDRDATPNLQFADAYRAENPLLRKFNLTERDRDRVTATVELAPNERFALNLTYFSTEDEYGRSHIGLNEGEEESLNLDITYSASETSSLYAFVSRDKIRSVITGAAGIQGVPWEAMTNDAIATWGLGFTGQARDKVSFGVDYVYSDSDGRVQTDSGAGEGPFPLLDTELTNLRLYLSYRVTEQWSFRLDAMRERYASSDWMIDGIGPDGLESVLTMGEVSPDYTIRALRLQAAYRF